MLIVFHMRVPFKKPSKFLDGIIAAHVRRDQAIKVPSGHGHSDVASRMLALRLNLPCMKRPSQSFRTPLAVSHDAEAAPVRACCKG